jgi:hypothetical protein
VRARPAKSALIADRRLTVVGHDRRTQRGITLHQRLHPVAGQFGGRHIGEIPSRAVSADDRHNQRNPAAVGELADQRVDLCGTRVGRHLHRRLAGCCVSADQHRENGSQ